MKTLHGERILVKKALNEQSRVQSTTSLNWRRSLRSTRVRLHCLNRLDEPSTLDKADLTPIRTILDPDW